MHPNRHCWNCWLPLLLRCGRRSSLRLDCKKPKKIFTQKKTGNNFPIPIFGDIHNETVSFVVVDVPHQKSRFRRIIPSVKERKTRTDQTDLTQTLLLYFQKHIRAMVLHQNRCISFFVLLELDPKRTRRSSGNVDANARLKKKIRRRKNCFGRLPFCPFAKAFVERRLLEKLENAVCCSKISRTSASKWSRAKKSNFDSKASRSKGPSFRCAPLSLKIKKNTIFLIFFSA